MSTEQKKGYYGTYRITGVPGGGKTSFLVRQIQRAIESHGAANIVVTSFTKAAATEIADKAMETSGQFLSKHQLGTLHALAYQALNKPKMIEVKKHLTEWNDHIRSRKPNLQLSTGGERDVDDLGISSQDFNTDGDKLFNQYGIYRNRMIDPIAYPDNLSNFVNEWEAWKTEVNGIDFTDMLTHALRDVDAIPFAPTVGFLDEANDCSRLQLALWSKWSKPLQYNIVGGDSAQCIYNFAGVDPGAFLEMELKEGHSIYKTESFRCPSAVVEYANRVIARCKQRDLNAEMKPRREKPGDLNSPIVQGFITHSSATFKTPEQAITEAQAYMDQGLNVAFLTTCSYMLNSLLQVLRTNAIPFENKYRRRRGDWNPLSPSNGVSAANKLISFAEKATEEDEVIITTSKLKQWIPVMTSAGVLKHGAKKAIEETLIELPAFSDLKKWFEPAAFAGICSGDIEWFEKNILKSKQKSFEFSLAIAKQHGLSKLKEKPQITVGTIHSVKGATFDVVFLFPDLSYQGYQQWHASANDRDAIIRTWYVGITRAREGVVLCAPTSEMAVGL